jgi:hypothetical protein
LTAEERPAEFNDYKVIFPMPAGNSEELARILLEIYRAYGGNGYESTETFLKLYRDDYSSQKKIASLLTEKKTPFIRSSLIFEGEALKISAYDFSRVRGIAYAIGAKSNNQDAARDFISYLTTPENLKKLAGNNFPASVLNEKFAVVSDLLPEIQRPDFYSLNEKLKLELQKLISGETSAENFAYWLENSIELE